MGFPHKEFDESGLWPTEDQLLLLKAALLDNRGAIDAWEAWRARINIDDDFDYGSFRLLPMLYHNMHRLGVEDDLMPRLKGVYRMAWYENHRLFHDIRPLLQAMAENGFSLLFLKGMPLVHHYYDHHALRPMADIDLLVPVDQVRKAIRFLEENDWKRNSLATDDDLKYRHSMQFCKPGKLELDLHWHVMLECCNEDHDELFWSRSTAVDVEGVKARRLDPTDFLLHTIIHGIRWNPEPPIRWIPDAMMILRKDTEEIDWARLCRDARSMQLSFRLALGLSFLKDNFDAAIPDFVVGQLHKDKTTVLERIENSYVLHNTERLFDTVFGKVWVIFAEYQRLAGKKSGFPTLAGFSFYLRHRLHLKSRREFLPMIVAGSLRRLRGTTVRGT